MFRVGCMMVVGRFFFGRSPVKHCEGPRPASTGHALRSWLLCGHRRPPPFRTMSFRSSAVRQSDSRMRILIATLVALTFTAHPGGARQDPTTADGTSSRSIWDGVYTEEQARRGKDLYLTHCVACHGESLQGGGPVHALVGSEFGATWNGLSMGDMLERTRISMPLDKPGTLSRQQIADVLSFVLSANKAPAGSVELPRQTELLGAIKFLATRPSGERRLPGSNPGSAY